jgi:type IV pilus assembly protein PilX
MKRQQGSSLLLVLIVLGIMVGGALAAVRSTNTASLIAGNAAFRAAAREAADGAENAAFAYLIADTALDTAVPNVYYPLRVANNPTTPDDSTGLPAIDWSTVASTQVGNNAVQWVVERMCTGALPVTDTTDNCLVDIQIAAGSNKIGSAAFAASANVFYRVTVRVRGPKNTESFAQTLISR